MTTRCEFLDLFSAHNLKVVLFRQSYGPAFGDNQLGIFGSVFLLDKCEEKYVKILCSATRCATFGNGFCSTKNEKNVW